MDFNPLYQADNPGHALRDWALTGHLPGQGGGAVVAESARATCPTCGKGLRRDNRTGYCTAHGKLIHQRARRAAARPTVDSAPARPRPTAGTAVPQTSNLRPQSSSLPTPICPECGEPALVFADFGARCVRCAEARDRQRGRSRRAVEPPLLQLVG